MAKLKPPSRGCWNTCKECDGDGALIQQCCEIHVQYFRLTKCLYCKGKGWIKASEDWRYHDDYD